MKPQMCWLPVALQLLLLVVFSVHALQLAPASRRQALLLVGAAACSGPIAIAQAKAVRPLRVCLVNAVNALESTNLLEQDMLMGNR
jgi:hypothetical protein